MVTHLYALVPAIPQTIYPYVGIIAIALGLLLAFFGETIWRIATTLIGGILGAVIGLAFGTTIAGLAGGLIVGLIGAIIGGLLFYYIAEAGIALMVAYFSFIGVLLLFGVSGGIMSRGTQTASIPFIMALIVAVIVFIVCIIYFKDLIAVFTALGGGFMVDYGLTVLKLGSVATVAALAVIVMGMTFQFVRLSRKKRHLTAIPKNEMSSARPSYVQDGNTES
jgi:hypothetical protein